MGEGRPHGEIREGEISLLNGGLPLDVCLGRVTSITRALKKKKKLRVCCQAVAAAVVNKRNEGRSS